MKRFALLTTITFVSIVNVFSAHPLGFKVVSYCEPGFNVGSGSTGDSLLLYRSGIDILYDWNYSFQNWCDRNNDRDTNRKIYYLTDCPGNGGWQFYTTGYGMVGRYLNWKLSGDSMAFWNVLANMCIDSMLTYHGDTAKGFGMYRFMDGDSGYNLGIGKTNAFDGLQLLYDRLQVDEAFSGSSATGKTHYSYLWGSYDFPHSIGYFLDKAPDMDVIGPGAYIFSSNDDSVVQAGLDDIISRCRIYVREVNARGKVYMPLVQCGEMSGGRPTLKQLRAASWVVLAYGSAWLGYYTYKGWSDGGVVDGNGKPFVTSPTVLNTALNTSIWNSGNTRDTTDDWWLNLYTVIKEIKEIGPTLANLNWLDGFGKKSTTTELPRGWVKAASGANRIEFGMFTHDESGEQYLMVINCDCAESDSVKNITLTLTPGPGRYTIRDVAKDSVICVDSTDDCGVLGTFTISNIPPGGGVLLHLDRTTFSDTISSNDPNATAGYNGRKIVADKFGGLHVVYTTKSGDTSKVWYAYRNTPYTSLTSGWSKQLIATDAQTPAIAVDCFGNPFITYRKGDSIRVSNLSKDVKIMKGTSAPSIAVDGTTGKGMVVVERSGSIFTRGFNLGDLSFPEYETNFKSNGQYPSVDLAEEVKSSTSSAFYLTFDPTKKETGLYRWLRFSSLNDDWGAIIGLSYPSGDVPSIDAFDRSEHQILVYRNNNNIRSCIGSDSAINIGTGSGTVESDDGLFAAWSNAGTQIKCAYNYQGDWIGENTLFSGNYAAYPHTAISWYHGKAYVFATVKSGAECSLWLTDSISTGDFGLDSARVINPNGPPQGDHEGVPYVLAYYMTGQTINVLWHLNDDADSSYVYANYDYPDGDWEPIAAKSGTDNTYAWKPTKGGSKCRVKVKVKYGNQYPEDISNSDFVIINISIEPTTYHIEYDPGEVNNLVYIPGNASKTVSWEAYSISGISNIELEVSRDGSETFVPLADSSTYDSTLTDTIIDGVDTSYAYTYTGVTWWTTPATPTSNGCLKLRAVSDNADTAYSGLFDGFIIAPPGGFAKNTYSNQRLLSSNNDGDKLGLVYTARDPEDTTKLSVLYMETSDGIDFTAPDTIKQGRWPAFSNGACMWKNAPTYCTKDTMWYSYQLNDTFSTPITVANINISADSIRFAPVGILSENDTVHLIIQHVKASHYQDTKSYTPSIIYLRFRETSPGSPYVDTIKISTSSYASYYDTSQIAGTLAKRGSTIYTSYDYLTNCYFTTITPPTHLEKDMGTGSQPQVALSEGNITYTYLPPGDTTIVRMCRYVDDTTWFRKDTLHLDHSASFLYDELGLMYGVQDKDTSLSHLYVYDPLSKEFYLTETYQGYYPHPYVDKESSEFSWITAYADMVDSNSTYLHTERQDMNVIIPALYLEAADKRSPYTIFRDTCVHYTSAVVDSGADSLRYRFPHLDDSKNYSTIIEFYNDADTLDSLQVTLGSEVDTIVIPANEYSWYEQNIGAGTDTMNLKIARISAGGYVPVSRVIVRQRSETGLFMMKGKPVIGPEKIVFCLFQPNPNPFSDAATIRYSLPYATNVSLKVYDISGRLVNTLVQGKVEPGVHSIRWEGKDNINRKCSSGVYFVRFVAADYRASKKMVMLK